MIIFKNKNKENETTILNTFGALLMIGVIIYLIIQVLRLVFMYQAFEITPTEILSGVSYEKM